MDKTLKAVPGALGRKRALIFLLNYVPLFHVAAVVAAPILLWNQGLAIWLPTTLLLLYFVPPVLARLLLLLFPIRARVVGLDSWSFVRWWALSCFQIVFDRFSFLEELLRLIPTVYSNWIRLWGSRIGRLTFWSPGVRILDRTHLRIGNDVVLGAGVLFAPHIIAQTPKGELVLLLDPIRIGDGVVVGGFSTLAPGTVIEDGEATRALLKSPPFFSLERWATHKDLCRGLVFVIFDMHVHVFGTEAKNGNKLELSSRGEWFARSMTRSLAHMGPQTLPTDTDVVDQILSWIDESVVDRAVLLALDWVYRPDGSRDVGRTSVACGNDFVHTASLRSPKALFGASVHPYRLDALDQLERVVELGACLIKWIPSAQRIRLDHPQCLPFYDQMARLRIPLLCHTGVEHVLSGGTVTLNDPRRLRSALERGVIVIAAHLGMRMTVFEPNHTRHWLRLLEEYPGLFGDVSALAVPWRAAMLRRLIAKEAVRDRMVYGSDFPHTAWPSALVVQLGLRKARRLARLANPLDRSYATTRALGLDESVFTRVEGLLSVA